MPLKEYGRFYSLWIFQGLIMGLISMVLCRTEGNVTTRNEDVQLGGSVTLRCNLTTLLEIVQVTWQKEINANSENIAVYTAERTDPNILQYKDRLNFTVLGLNESAITFWNVSTQENGCYTCIFHLLPVLTLSNKPCLSVYANLSAFMHFKIYDGVLNATCFATAFPRPHISWVTPSSEKSEIEFTNPNGTVSVISSIQVNTSSSQYGQDLICKVTHRNVDMIVKVPMNKRGHWNPVSVVLTVLALLLVVLIILVVCWRRHRKKHSATMPESFGSE